MTIIVMDADGAPHKLNLMEGIMIIRRDHVKIGNETLFFDEHGFYLPKEEVMNDSPTS